MLLFYNYEKKLDKYWCLVTTLCILYINIISNIFYTHIPIDMCTGLVRCACVHLYTLTKHYILFKFLIYLLNNIKIIVN